MELIEETPTPVAGPSSSASVPLPRAESPQLGAAEYLFSRENLHDCHFKVGGADGEDTPETMGVVKAMLLAHSPVFRNMLQESDLREDTSHAIPLPDVQPDAFKLLLKYVYNALEEPLQLSRDMAMKLFFAADKYLIEPLRQKAIDQLIPRAVEEVFPALYCITLCTTGIDTLQSIVKTVVQTRTMQVFECPQFLEMDLDSLVYIVKQPMLNCREVEVWRAAVKWAEHQSQSSEGPLLRQQLREPLKHIRLCTMTTQQIFTEVGPRKILTDTELLAVLHIINVSEPEGETGPTPEFCVSKSLRQLSERPWFNPPSWGVYCDLGHRAYVGDEKVSGCRMDTGGYPMILKSITCRGKKSPFSDIDFLTGTQKYRCLGKVILSLYDNNHPLTMQEVCVMQFDEEVRYEEEFTVVTMFQGSYFKLSQSTVYRIHLEFTEPHPRWSSQLRDGEPVCGEHRFEDGWLDCYWSCNHMVRLHITRQ